MILHGWASDENVVQVDTHLGDALEQGFDGALKYTWSRGHTKRKVVVLEETLVSVNDWVLPGILRQGYLLVGMLEI